MAWLAVGWLTFIARRLGVHVLRQAGAATGRVNCVRPWQIVHRCALAHQGDGYRVGRCVLAICPLTTITAFTPAVVAAATALTAWFPIALRALTWCAVTLVLAGFKGRPVRTTRRCS